MTAYCMWLTAYFDAWQKYFTGLFGVRDFDIESPPPRRGVEDWWH